MKKKEKITFLESVLKNKYCPDNYLKFLNHTFNIGVLEKEIDQKDKFLKIENRYAPFIVSCKNLYLYEENGKRISFLEVELHSDFDFFSERDRNFFSSILQNQNYDYALVAFYKKNSSNWELSFIKNINFPLEDSLETKKIDSIKRISYSLGEKAFLYFPEEQFKIFIKGDTELSIKALEKIFNLEKLTKNFFEDYKALYLDLKESLDKNPEYKTEFSSMDYTKLFLEKEVFLFFLEKKNWEKNKKLDILKDLFPMEKTYLDSKKNKLFKVFNKYEFSLKENEPYEIQLAVDPEMLGKVFENLLEIQDKRSKGTFYTPREIVCYISKETILHTLLEAFPDANKRELFPLIFLGELILEEDKKNISKNLKMPKFVRENAILLDNSLKELKIIDPATGSGAFPIGILHEIVKIRKILTEYFPKNQILKESSNRTLFQLKKETIENSLYGVDIEKHAVEITKFRLYLSLLVHCENKIEFFSSMKFNFLVANALTENLKEKKDFFPKNSFDIVIGNPPYVGEKGNKEIFREISLTDFGKRFYMGKGDLLYLFFHLGLDFLKEKGVLGFITTNYYLTADGGKKLREDLKIRANIFSLINFNNLIVFEKAKGQHNLVTLLEKNSIKERALETILCDKNLSLGLDDLDEIFFKTSSKVSYHQLSPFEIYDGEKSYIRMEKDEIISILEKMKKGSILLKDQFFVKQGIVSGADRFSLSHKHKFLIDEEVGRGIFILTEEEINSLNLNSEELNLIKPFYKNSDIYSYVNNEIPKLWIIYITKNQNIDDFPNIKNHLLKYKAILGNKRECKTGRLPWYSLHWAREFSIFNSPKIITRQRCKTNMFSYNESQWFSSADVYYINSKVENNSQFNLKYILALLNSKLFFVWLYKYGKRKGELLELYSTPLEELPIKNVSLDTQNEIAALVDLIIQKKRLGENSNELENHLNNIVYKIYFLTEKEITIVNKFISLCY